LHEKEDDMALDETGRYSDDDLEWLRVCLKVDGIVPHEVDMVTIMDEAFEEVTDMADFETGYAVRDDVDFDEVVARHAYDTASSGSRQHVIEAGRYLDPFSCAECGATGDRTYVVTVMDDGETRTEVCRDCDDALRSPEHATAEQVADALIAVPNSIASIMAASYPRDVRAMLIAAIEADRAHSEVD
jgi:hypothetical protein